MAPDAGYLGVVQRENGGGKWQLWMDIGAVLSIIWVAVWWIGVPRPYEIVAPGRSYSFWLSLAPIFVLIGVFVSALALGPLISKIGIKTFLPIWARWLLFGTCIGATVFLAQRGSELTRVNKLIRGAEQKKQQEIEGRYAPLLNKIENAQTKLQGQLDEMQRTNASNVKAISALKAERDAVQKENEDLRKEKEAEEAKVKEAQNQIATSVKNGEKPVADAPTGIDQSPTSGPSTNSNSFGGLTSTPPPASGSTTSSDDTSSGGDVGNLAITAAFGLLLADNPGLIVLAPLLDSLFSGSDVTVKSVLDAASKAMKDGVFDEKAFAKALTDDFGRKATSDPAKATDDLIKFLKKAAASGSLPGVNLDPIIKDYEKYRKQLNDEAMRSIASVLGKTGFESFTKLWDDDVVKSAKSPAEKVESMYNELQNKYGLSPQKINLILNALAEKTLNGDALKSFQTALAQKSQ